jgi:chemotaxis protein CheX
MLMEQFTELSQDIVDAVGEITNMVCGGAKAEFQHAGLLFDMATPVVLTGKDIELSMLSRTEVISVPLTTAEGTFVIESSLGPR